MGKTSANDDNLNRVSWLQVAMVAIRWVGKEDLWGKTFKRRSEWLDGGGHGMVSQDMLVFLEWGNTGETGIKDNS